MNKSIRIKNLRKSRFVPYLHAFILAVVIPSNSVTAYDSTLAQITAATYSTERDAGIELYRQGKFKDATKQLKKAVKKNKNDAEAWQYLGMALLEENAIKDASKAFETALKLQPTLALARLGLGYSFLARNKLGDAMREARAVLDIDSKSGSAHYIIGVVHLRSGEPDAALKEAAEAIRLQPNSAGPYLLKSQALVGIYSKKIVEAALTRRPPSSQLTSEERAERRKRRLLADALLLEAAESLEIYLKLNPSDRSTTWREQLEALKVFSSYRLDNTNIEKTVFHGDDVTTKVRVLAKPEPSYTESAREAGITGTVILRAVFAEDGTIRHILVISGLPLGLTERAIKAARKIKFNPATIDGRPVSMFIQLEYNFNLY